MRRALLAQALMLTVLAPIRAVPQQAETEVVCNDATEPLVLRNGENDEIRFGDHTEGCTLSSGTDLDQLRFTGEIGDVVRISIRSLSNGLDPTIEIFGPDLIEIGARTVCSGNAPSTPAFACSVSRELTIAQSGAHSIIVTDDGTNESGGYGLHLERLWPRLDAPAVPYNGSTQDGLSPTTDVDTFLFEGAAATRIRLSVLSLTPGLDPVVSLRDPEGTPLTLVPTTCAGNAPSTPPFICSLNPSPELNLTLDGTYSLAFTDSNIDEVGGYEFAVNCLLGSCPGFEAAALDSFDRYAPGPGVSEAIGDETFYSIRADAGEGEGVVGSLTGPQAVATSLRKRGSDVLWEVSSAPDPEAAEGSLVMKASLPGISSGPRAGDFGSLFQNLQDLQDQSLAIAFETPDPGAQCKLSASLVAVDDEGNRSATPRFEIDSEAAFVQLPFVDFLSPLTTVAADLLNIARIDIEFYAEANGAPAASCFLDDAEIKLLAPPANDVAIDAARVDRGKRLVGTLTEATVDGPGPNPDVWYKLESPESGVVEIDTCGTGEYGIDTLLSLHSTAPGTVGNQLVTNDDWTTATSLSARTLKRCQERGTSADAAVRANVAAGQTVWVRVTRPAGPASGPFLLAVPEAGELVNASAACASLCAARRIGSRVRADRAVRSDVAS